MSTIIHNLSTEYINIGCNRVSQVAAWGIDGLVAFGANNYVALYYPEVYNKPIQFFLIENE